MPLDIARSALAGYRGYRPDVLSLIDPAPRSVLDVGCGAGGLGAELASRYPGSVAYGIERDPALRAQAAPNYRGVFDIDLHDVASLAAIEQRFDLIVAADVLEHVAEPADTLRALVALLEPGGRVITSIPNVRHYSTLVALLFTGRWPQRDRGIHDRTHLRYFARADILDLLAAAGLEPECERRNLRLIEPWSWTNPPAKLLDFWPLRPFLTFQYLHRSRRRDEPRARP